MHRLLTAFILVLAAGPGLAGTSTLWQQGVALTVEHILTHDYQEVVVEQQIPVDAPAAEVWNVLSDLQQYPTFYPLLGRLDIHQDYYRNAIHITEFTTRHQQRSGRFYIEEQFYGIIEADSDNRELLIKLWQLDEAYIHARIRLQEGGPYHSLLTITTSLYAGPDALTQLTRRELSRPLFQAAAFKYLMEEGVALPQCLNLSGNNRFCL